VRLAKIKQRWLSLRTTPQKPILKVFEQSIEARVRINEEKKRIIEHPLFFDGTWISFPKVTFHEKVIFNRN
jgi:hypothetical protein